MSENKIVIVSEYIDLSSDKIKKSFAESEQAVDRYAAAIDRMSANMQRTMEESSKKTVDAINKINTGLRQSKKPQDEVIGGAARMAKAYEAFRIELARIRNAVLLVTFGLRPFIGAIRESIKAASEQEDATHRMNTALKLQGFYSAEVSKRNTEFAASMQDVTRYGDDMIEKVIQKLVSTGDVLPSQIQRVTKATLDYAAATGRDLPTAANVVSKAMAGFTGELSRYGIFIDRTIPKNQKAAAALAELENRFGGSAQQDINTYSGRIAQMANNFNDLQESIGRILIDKFQLGEVINYWSDLVKSAVPTDVDTTKIAALDQQITHIQEKIAKMKYLAAHPLEKIAFETFGNEPVTNQTDINNAIIQLEQLQKAREKEVSLNQRLVDSRRKVVETDANFGGEKVAAEIKSFNTRLDEFQNQSKEVRLKNLNEEFEAYQSLVDRKFEIEQGFADEMIALKETQAHAMTDADRKAIDDEMKGLQEREQAYRVFVANSVQLDEMRRKETFEILDKTLDFVDQFGKASANALEDGFFAVAKGKFEDLSDIAASFGDQMIKILIHMATTAALTSIGFPGFHQGSYVRHGSQTSAGYSPGPGGGRPYAGKFHSGGEVDATLLEGEGVVNRKGMESLGVNNLNKLNRGQGMGGGNTTNNYYIQTIDERSFRERLMQNPDVYENAVGNGVSDNRKIRKTLQRFS